MTEHSKKDNNSKQPTIDVSVVIERTDVPDELKSQPATVKQTTTVSITNNTNKQHLLALNLKFLDRYTETLKEHNFFQDVYKHIDERLEKILQDAHLSISGIRKNNEITYVSLNL